MNEALRASPSGICTRPWGIQAIGSGRLHLPEPYRLGSTTTRRLRSAPCTKPYFRQYWPCVDDQPALQPMQRIPRARYAIRTWWLTSRDCPMGMLVVRGSGVGLSAPVAWDAHTSGNAARWAWLARSRMLALQPVPFPSSQEAPTPREPDPADRDC